MRMTVDAIGYAVPELVFPELSHQVLAM